MRDKPLSIEERKNTSVMVLATSMTLRNILVDTLRRLDYRKIVVSKSPEEAIKTVQAMPPDLLLIQNYVSDGDNNPFGTRLAAVLRKHFQFPIIAISSEKPGMEVLLDCTKDGINHLIPLALSAESLNRTINQTFMLDMLLLPRLKHMKENACRAC